MAGPTRFLSGLAFVLMACAASLPGTPLSIDTAGFQLGLGGCAGAGIPPFQIERDGDALRYVQIGTQVDVRIVWPMGFAARLQDGRAVLYASDGAVVGREGDVLDSIGTCGSTEGAYNAASVGTKMYR